MAPKSPVYNLYFYQNGSSNSSVNPEEVKIRKNELSLSIKKRGKSIYYVGKPLFSLKGDIVESFNEIKNYGVYVIANQNESFIHRNYTQRYEDYCKRIKVDSLLRSRPEECEKLRKRPPSVLVSQRFCRDLKRMPSQQEISTGNQETNIRVKTDGRKIRPKTPLMISSYFGMYENSSRIPELKSTVNALQTVETDNNTRPKTVDYPIRPKKFTKEEELYLIERFKSEDKKEKAQNLLKLSQKRTKSKKLN